MGENFDLLGDPIPEGFGKRGRPAHLATDEKRKLVMMLLAFDWTQERIAAALSITPPTLRLNYFRQLRMKAEARARVDALQMDSLRREVEAGNVTAIREMYKRLDKHDLALMGFVPDRKSAKGPKLGKKEQARLDAQTPAPGTTMGDLMTQRQLALRSGKPN